VLGVDNIITNIEAQRFRCHFSPFSGQPGPSSLLPPHRPPKRLAAGLPRLLL